jgi:putative Holliday junction resolvase
LIESVKIERSSLADIPTQGTVIAFDFGLKRIGVAVGELNFKVAHPLTVIVNHHKRETDFSTITKLIQEWQPKLLVVGLPAFMDGKEHELSKLSTTFAEQLEKCFKIRTVLVDERLTSAAASQSLDEIGIRGYKQKDKLDQVAAQQILQTFFENLKDAP